MQITLTAAAFLYALLAIPVLAILYLFIPQARRVVVGSLLFWQDAATEAGLDRSSRRRRIDLAAVLLLAALTAILLALAGPQLVRSEPTGPAGVVLVDRSSSLLMTDGGSLTRLARLRRQVDDFLAGLPGDLPIELRLAPESRSGNRLQGPAAEVRLGAAAILQRTEATLSPAELRRQAVLLADQAEAPVMLFTDLSPFGAAEPAPEGVSVQATGGHAANVALTGSGVAWRDGRPVALIETFASQRAPRTARVTLSGDGLALGETLDLAPGPGAWTLALAEPLPSRMTVRLEARDDFAADNSLELMRLASRRYRIGLVGRADAALLRFLTLALGADVYEFDDAAAATESRVDLTFFVDRLPDESFRGPAVLVNPPESTGPLSRTDRSGGPGRWTVVAPEDPLVAHLATAAVQVASHPVFEAGPGAAVLVTSAEGHPLVVRYAGPGGGRAAWVAVLFDIERPNTTWSLEASFVIFWADCVATLAAEAPSSPAYAPVNVWDPLLGRIEGRQTDGPAVDESAAGRERFVAHERTIRPTVMPLWPAFALLAAAMLVARVWVLR